ncbi:MAG: hypothetical protein WDA28_13185 [Castellaniella sp.]
MTPITALVVGKQKRVIADFCRRLPAALPGLFAIGDMPKTPTLTHVVIYAVDIRLAIPTTDVTALGEISKHHPVIIVGDVATKNTVSSYRKWLDTAINGTKHKFPIFMINSAKNMDFDNLAAAVSSLAGFIVDHILRAKSADQLKWALDINWESAVIAAMQILPMVSDEPNLATFGKQLLTLRAAQVGRSCLIPHAELVKTRPLKNAVRAVMLLPEYCRRQLLDCQYEYELLCINANDLSIGQYLTLASNHIIYVDNARDIAWGRENYTDFMTADEIVESQKYPSKAISLLANSRYGPLMTLAYAADVDASMLAIISEFIGRTISPDDVADIPAEKVTFPAWWNDGQSTTADIPRWNFHIRLLRLLAK